MCPTCKNDACLNATYKQGSSHYVVLERSKQFLAYEYIFKYDIYILERGLFKKIYDHHFKFIRHSFHSDNCNTNSHVPHSDLLLCLCKFFWVVKTIHMLEC